MVFITGQGGSFLKIFETPISISIKSNPFFALLSSSVSMANLNSLFIRLHGQLEQFGSCIILQSCFSFFFSLNISTANLRCLLVTTFSSLSFLSNSFSSPQFNLLRVARRCFSLSSFSDTFSFPLVIFLLSFLFYLFHVRLCFLCLKLCLL